jgi:hypothetical protein
MPGEEEKAGGIESVPRIPSRPLVTSTTFSARLDERFGSGPLKIRPSAKFPAEFRTLRSDFAQLFCTFTYWTL